jgi:hypothetical protein
MSLTQGHVVHTGPMGRRDRRRQRRALRDRDRASAKLAELFRIDALLAEAAHVIERGWLQNGWFTYVDGSGSRVLVTGCSPRIARRLSTEQVTSTCLVGAIVHAAGGPSEAGSQLVKRSIDLTWHASYRGAHERIRWCPAATERAGHVMDLVRWNDTPGRTAGEVLALLDRARALGHAEVERTRAVLRTG